MLDADGRRLQGKRFGLRERRLPFLCVLGSVVFTILGLTEVVVMEVGWKRGGHWGLLEAGGVGGGLTTKLGQIEVGAGTVAEVH